MSNVIAEKLTKSLSGDSRICLRRDVRFDSVTPSNVIETTDSLITVQGVSPETLRGVLTALDGRRSIAKIAEDRGVPVSKVRDICLQLVRLGIAVPLNGAPLIVSAEDFAGLCNRLYSVWKERVFSHPLWVNLAAGTASRSRGTR